MESERPADVDLGTDDPGDDPLADVESESVFDAEEGGEELPPGVQQGTLGGENPSQEAEAHANPHDPLSDDPGPEQGEFLEDPDEREVGTPDEPEEPAAEAEPEPTPADDPAPPPDAEPEPEPEPPAPEPEPTPEPEPPADPAPTPEPTPEEQPEMPAPEDTTEVAGSGENKEEPEAEQPPPEEPAEEKKPPPKKSGRKRGPGRPRKPAGQKKSREGKGPDSRNYVPFQKAENLTGEELVALAQEGRLWITHEPVKSRSGQYALRSTYRDLSQGDEASYELAAVPAKLWTPKKVSGRKLDQMAISVG